MHQNVAVIEEVESCGTLQCVNLFPEFQLMVIKLLGVFDA